MEALTYLLLVNIYLVLFYAFYALFLQNETFFKLNRIYLVGGAMMSFMIPFLQSEWIRSLFITRQVEEAKQNIALTFSGQELIITAQEQSLTTGEAILIIYLAGAVFFLFRFLWRLHRVRLVLNSGDTENAFSFFNSVKVGNHVPHRGTVFNHELVHARHWHSADVIMFEIISIINWFNPVVYLYREAIKYIHEFTADEIASQYEESKSAYATVLLSETFGIPSHQLTNSFYNHSLLKRRIIMLNKSKSNRNALLKYGLSAPLFAAMMILSSATIHNEIEQVEKGREQSGDFPKAMILADDGKDMVEDNTALNPIIHKTKRLPQSLTTNKPNHSLSDTVPEAPFTQVELSPEPVGGFKTFYENFTKDFKYPTSESKSVNGKIIIQFVVERDGNLADIAVLRGISNSINDEAVRVLRSLPKWKPGIKNGKVVPAAFTLPITISPQASGEAPKSAAINGIGTTNNQENLERRKKESDTYSTKGNISITDGDMTLQGKDNKVSIDNFKGLLFVNGIESQNDQIKLLDPDTIESMNVLDEKSAVKKYGKRAKNGAIEITTKRK